MKKKIDVIGFRRDLESLEKLNMDTFLGVFLFIYLI